MGAPIVSQPANNSNPDGARDAAGTEGIDAPEAAFSGRPAFDRRGTTVWEWQTATGVFSQDASTTRVQRLQVHDLSIEKTAIVKQVGIDEPPLTVAPCGGFNPYDNAPSRRTTSVAKRPSGGIAAARWPPTRPALLAPHRPTTLMERLRALFAGK